MFLNFKKKVFLTLSLHRKLVKDVFESTEVCYDIKPPYPIGYLS